MRQDRLSHCFWIVRQLYLSQPLVPYQINVLERDYREWDNSSHSPQGKHYLTLLQSELMKFKAIIYQNNPKKIHGSCEGIDLCLIRHNYVYEEKEIRKTK